MNNNYKINPNKISYKTKEVELMDYESDLFSIEAELKDLISLSLTLKQITDRLNNTINDLRPIINNLEIKNDTVSSVFHWKISTEKTITSNEINIFKD